MAERKGFEPLVAAPLEGLGKTYREQGRLDEARPLYERALRSLLAAHGFEHRRTRDLGEAYIEFLRKMGDEERAREVENRLRGDESLAH